MDFYEDKFWSEFQTHLPKENATDKSSMPGEYFIDLAGCKIHIDHYKKLVPRARIIMFHGVGGNGRLLSFIAQPLMRRGFEVICPDLPLFGQTVCADKPTYETWVNVAEALVRHYIIDGVPTFLFGFSAGGMLAYQTACRVKTVLGILSTCILDMRSFKVRAGVAHSLIFGLLSPFFAKIGTLFFGNMKLPVRFFCKMKKISRVKAVSKLIMSDRHSGGASVPIAFLKTLLYPRIEIAPEDFTIPFILLHPEKDKMTDIRISNVFYKRLGCQKRMLLLEDGGHLPVEHKALAQLEKYSADFILEVLKTAPKVPHVPAPPDVDALTHA